jgi:hypothetical protein
MEKRWVTEMKTLSETLLPLAMVLAAALPTAAQAQQYYCTLSSVTNNWVPPEFLITYSGSTADVTHGWPIAGDVGSGGIRQRLQWQWVLRSSLTPFRG